MRLQTGLSAPTYLQMETEMNDEKLNALLDDMDKRVIQAEKIAHMQALQFVNSAAAEDRASAQQYLREAGIWREAKQLICKHRAS